MNKNLKKLLAAPYIIWMIGFTVIPLLLIVVYGLTDKNGIPTIANIVAMSTPEHMKALLLSLGLSFISTVICLVISYPLAMILRKRGISSGSFMVFVFILPMWMNFLLRTLAWQTLLEKNGVINGVLSALHLPNIAIINTPAAIVLGMVYNFLPFMILPIHTALKKMDQRVVEAALDLGASPRRVFTRVTLPLSLPGVVSGITMVFMPSVTTFAISRLLGEGNTRLIGDLIEDKFLRSTTNTVVNGWGVGSTLSLFMLILIVISIWLLNRIDPKREGA